MKCREKLAGYVVNYANWYVLFFRSEERSELEEGDARLSPYISGELHHHIRSCAQHNDELADYISQHKDVADNYLIACANVRSCMFQYLVSCMNEIRADVNDFEHPWRLEDDWFRPFVKSMLICKEDDYRSKIGLPTLLPFSLPAGLTYRRHSTFLTYVLEGVRNPLSYWEFGTPFKTRRCELEDEGPDVVAETTAVQIR